MDVAEAGAPPPPVSATFWIVNRRPFTLTVPDDESLAKLVSFWNSRSRLKKLPLNVKVNGIALKPAELAVAAAAAEAPPPAPDGPPEAVIAPKKTCLCSAASAISYTSDGV